MNIMAIHIVSIGLSDLYLYRFEKNYFDAKWALGLRLP